MQVSQSESTIDESREFDCLVLGNGPAACTVATAAAQAGRSVVLVDCGSARPNLGESLLPENHDTLDRLGLVERLKASHFPKKYGVHFLDHGGDELHSFCYLARENGDECEGTGELSQTWQTLRSELDTLLWNNAAEKGVACLKNVRSVKVVFERPGDTTSRAVGAQLQRPSCSEQEIHAKVVVDASGLPSLLPASPATLSASAATGPALAAHVPNAALWGWYRGVRRDPGIDAGATQVFNTRNGQAWIWFVPLPDDIVGVAVVARAAHLLEGRGTPESVFEEHLVKCPAAAERLMQAQLAGEFRVLRAAAPQNPSAVAPSAGEGWVRLPETQGFGDATFAPSPFLSLSCGERAADAIDEGLRRGDTSAGQLGCWIAGFARGVERLGRLAGAFYAPGFCFGQFLAAFPQHRGPLAGLLAGAAFDKMADAMLSDLETWRYDLDTRLEESSA